MPVKNEEWILERTLTCLSMFFEHIIVADQNSTDATPEICKKFPKVVYIKNEMVEYDEGKRRQFLLDAARAYEGNNFIANIAADEILSANILKPDAFERLVDGCKPGTSFSWQWVQLWRSEGQYRNDASVWSNSYRPFAFIDDRKTNYHPGFAHLSLVPEDFLDNIVVSREMKVLHYQFVEFDRLLAKQRWARLLEYEKYPQPIFLRSIILNNKYYITKDEHDLRLTDTPAEWLAPYPPYTKKQVGQPWHIATSQAFIEKYGSENLRWLDIWDFDWEKYPDKRNMIQRFYHAHQYPILWISDRTPKWIKQAIKSI